MSIDRELEEIRKRKLESLLREASAPIYFKAGEVTPLTSETFDGALNASKRPVLVDFWAAWCCPCRMVAPVVEGLARDYLGRVDFGKVDVDANPAVAARFSVVSIPTLIVFRSGRVAERVVGAQGRPTLESMLTRHFS